jgi:uncharacterized membrane protein (Fun14 family)
LYVQGLAYGGFITVNWSHVHKSMNVMLDVNHDGKLDATDFKAVVKKSLGILSQGVPSVGGFLSGLMLGLKA